MVFEDEEIRKRHRIGEEIPILRRLPTSTEVVREKSFLAKVSESFGAQEWMWKSLAGKLIAIVIVTPAAFSAMDWWAEKIEIASEVASPYLATAIETLHDQSNKLVMSIEGDPEKSILGGHSQIIIPRHKVPLFDNHQIQTVRLFRALRTEFAVESGLLSAPTMESFRQERLINFEIRFSLLKYFDYLRNAAFVPTRWADAGAPVAYFSLDHLDAVQEMTFHVNQHAMAQPNANMLHYGFLIYELSFEGRVEAVPPNLESGDMRRKYTKNWLQRHAADILLLPATRIPDSSFAMLNLSQKNIEKLQLMSVKEVTVFPTMST